MLRTGLSFGVSLIRPEGIARTVAMLIVVAGLMGAATDANAALVLRLEADNYDPGTWAWTDTSGNNNHATQGLGANSEPPDAAAPPALVPGVTANGSSVVRFAGDDFLDFPTILPTLDADGFTVFTFLRPVAPAEGAWPSIVAGFFGGFSYSLTAENKQWVDRSYQEGIGDSDTPLSHTEFSSINTKANDVGGSFRLNGADDGTMGGSTYSAGIFRIGASLEGKYPFVGDIAEIRVYDTQLTLPEIQAVEAELNAAYADTSIVLTWDESVANWNDVAGGISHWIGGLPGDIPDSTNPVTIEAGACTVPGLYTAEAKWLTVGDTAQLNVAADGGLTVVNALTIGAEGTLDIDGTLTATTASLTSQGTVTIDQATLPVDSLNVAGGSLTTLGDVAVTGLAAVSGSSTIIDIGGALTASSADVSDGSLTTAGGVSVTGVATISGGSTDIGGALAAGSANVSGGLLDMVGANITALTISGTGAVTSTASMDVTTTANISGGSLDTAGANIDDLTISSTGQLQTSADVNVNAAIVTGGTHDLGGNLLNVAKSLKLGSVSYETDSTPFTAANVDGSTDLLAGANLTIDGGTLTITGPPSAGGELIPNGGFEDPVLGDGVVQNYAKGGTDGPPGGWIFHDFGQGSVVNPASPDAAPEGENVVKIVPTTDAIVLNNNPVTIPEVLAGEVYTFSAQVKALGPNSYLDVWLGFNDYTDWFTPFAGDVPNDGAYHPIQFTIDVDTDLGDEGTSMIGATNVTPEFGHPAFGSGMIIDAVSLTIADSPSFVDQPSTNLLVTATAEVASAGAVRLGNLTIANPSTTLTLSGDEYTFADVTTPEESTIAGEVIVRGGLNIGASPGVLNVEGSFELADEAVYNCEIGEWDSTTELDPWTNMPAGGPVNDQLQMIVGDAYLAGTLELTALTKLHPVKGDGSQWFGEQTRMITAAVGDNSISYSFTATPTPLPEDFGAAQWGEGHLGRGVFLTRENNGGENDVPGVSYTAAGTQVHLFQALDGDTNGNAILDTADIFSILGAGSFLKPGEWDWTEGDFDGDNDVDTTDIFAILATGKWGNFDPYYPEPGKGSAAKGEADATGDSETLVDLIVNAATGEVSVDTNGAEITGYMISSESGALTGDEAATQFALSQQTADQIADMLPLGMAFAGVHDLGSVLQGDGSDLTLTYTLAGQTGVFQGNIKVVPEPGTLAMLLGTGLLGLLLTVLLRRRDG